VCERYTLEFVPFFALAINPRHVTFPPNFPDFGYDVHTLFSQHKHFSWNILGKNLEAVLLIQ
jgi:hypothetical protein